MAVAAFKSSSRRGNQPSTPSTSLTSSSSTRPSREQQRNNKPPIRRSRSVSAFPTTTTTTTTTNLHVSTEFLNKRDNPLFLTATSPRDDQIQSPNTVEASKFSDPKEPGRSLSRADSGRRNRSASQCPVSRRHFHSSTSESEAESKDRKGGLFRSGNGRPNGVLEQAKDLHTWSSQHSSIETRNCEDTVSTASSGYCSDEKTIKAVCERMRSVQADLPEASDIYETVRSEVRRAISEIRNDLESAIQSSNVTTIAVTNVADIPPDLVNPGAVELVLEIRREYAKKLEESLERARNLRADLAVEEHRGQELDRILKEVLPYPKTPNVQKSRPARKASIERRKMSKRLAEDAKAYFDECVSLSTFDSSDFSSQEDPPLNLVGPPTPSGSLVCLPEESGIRRQSMNIHYDISQPPASIGAVGQIHGQVSSITCTTETGCKPYFSFAQKTSENSGLQQGIQQYIKKFEKNVLKLSTMRSNYCDLHEYSYQSSAESLLIDRVLLKNRIDSGSLLLCGGGNMSSKSCGIGI